MFGASYWPWFQFTANDEILPVIRILMGLFEVCYDTLDEKMLFLFDFVTLNHYVIVQ